MSVGWLKDGTEESLRSALTIGAPELADLPMKINSRHAASNPLWWSSSAVVDGRFVVKFAWSEMRAVRLWREGVVLERLRMHKPSLPVPELVALSREPALVVTRLVAGLPLSWGWASGLTTQRRQRSHANLPGSWYGCTAWRLRTSFAISRPSSRRPKRIPNVSVVASHALSTIVEEHR